MAYFFLNHPSAGFLHPKSFEQTCIMNLKILIVGGSSQATFSVALRCAGRRLPSLDAVTFVSREVPELSNLLVCAAGCRLLQCFALAACESCPPPTLPALRDPGAGRLPKGLLE
jgi:hypothetical protein